MKTLLLLKRLDLLVQIFALVVPALLALRTGQYFSLFYLYFFVGGAQVVSFLAHLMSRQAPWIAPGRAKYTKVLAWLLAVAFAFISVARLWPDIGAMVPLIGIVYLVVTPIVAVWYFVLCFGETQRVLQAARRKSLIVK